MQPHTLRGQLNRIECKSAPEANVCGAEVTPLQKLFSQMVWNTSVAFCCGVCRHFSSSWLLQNLWVLLEIYHTLREANSSDVALHSSQAITYKRDGQKHAFKFFAKTLRRSLRFFKKDVHFVLAGVFSLLYFKLEPHASDFILSFFPLFVMSPVKEPIDFLSKALCHSHIVSILSDAAKAIGGRRQKYEKKQLER